MSGRNVKSITPKQLNALRYTLAKQGKHEDEADLVYSYTKGRTYEADEMTIVEARELLMELNRNTESGKKDRMIGKVYSIGYDLGLISPKTQKKIDRKRLTALVARLTPAKGKGLKEHSNNELQALLTVMKKYREEQLAK